MSFQVRTEERAFGSWTSVVVVLEKGGGTVRAEVLPDFGFNCWRWQTLVAGQREFSGDALRVDGEIDATQPCDCPAIHHQHHAPPREVAL